MRTLFKKWHIALLSVAYFILFKIAFPNPDLFLDSVGYLQAGLTNQKISYRPMGYSDFLMFFRDIPNASFLIVLVQYIVFAFSAIFFNQTIFHIFKINRKFHWIFWVLTLFNPICYFLINMISPDALFMSLSAIWMASLLRFVLGEKQTYLYGGIHLLSFFFLFYLRFNAVYYPFFSVLAVLLGRMKLPVKAVFAAANLALFGFVYNGVVNTAEEQTGSRILSAFGGWVNANNAIHLLKAQSVDTNIFTDPEQQMLHRFVLTFKDSLDASDDVVTDQYMWNKKAPLKQYLMYSLQARRYPDYFTGWWNVSTLYNEYGNTLIRHYPGAFFKAYYLPNFYLYLKPPPETLIGYASLHQKLTPEWQQYFDYTGEEFTARFPKVEGIIVAALGYLFPILSILTLLASLLGIVRFAGDFIRKKGKSLEPTQLATFILCAFYLLSLVLLIYAHPIRLRYIALLIVYFSGLPLLVLIAYYARLRSIFTKEPTLA